MIFCPDGIIPDSGLTGLNNTYIYIYILHKILCKVYFYIKIDLHFFKCSN